MTTYTLSPTRVTLLRVMYLFIVFGNALTILPLIVFPENNIADANTVVASMLGALMLLSGVGILFPTKMLPILLWELTWKTIWMFNFALRMWLDGGLDSYAQESAVAVAVGLVTVPLVLPWKYLYHSYQPRLREPWFGVRLDSTGGES
ncbi:hypothetical protein P886_0486 [Alteromonadaceae bacterium 2753L.S.0a.02]|nr:hypothetical protein P886_0486 [Alteromonadaceae bacterium 2753L.S.0a.02]